MVPTPNPISLPPLQLDLAVACFDTTGQYLGASYYGDLDPFNGAVVHTGDNRSGKRRHEINVDVDDENVNIDVDLFAMMKPRVAYLFVTVNSFSGASFRTVKSASCRVVAAQTQTELASCVMSVEGRFFFFTKVGYYRPCRDFAQDYSAAVRRFMFAGRIQLYLTCIVRVLNQ